MQEIDSEFGHWFAGFTDGEGCFTIQPVSRYFYCRFIIGLRSDDAPIIYEIHQKLSIGTIREKTSPSMQGYSQITFDVSSKSDCLVLRDLFQTYPLRAKKARDFSIWSEALEVSLERRKSPDYRDKMISLKRALEDNRKFKEPSPDV